MTEYTWVRGAYPAAITPRGVVVMATGNLDMAHQLWRLLHEGGDLSTLMQRLTATYAADLASLPEFVAVIPDGDGIHVAVRGGFELVVRTHEGTQSITSGSVIMWMEHRFSRAIGWRINSIASGDLADLRPESWAVADAVVPVSVVEVGDNYSDNVPSGTEDTTGGEDPTPDATPESVQSPDLAPASLSETIKEDPTITETGLYGAIEEYLAGGGAQEPAEETDESAAYLKPEIQNVTDVQPEDPTLGEDGKENSLIPEHTVHHNNKHIDKAEDLAEIRSREPQQLLLSPSPVPLRSSRSLSPQDQKDRKGDHDGLTVRSIKTYQLPAKAHDLANISMADAADDGKPRVVALLCTGGHWNPTHAQSCRECGAPMSETSMSIPQPKLGTLVASDGASEELYGDIIIGRQPNVHPAMGERQRALVVPSPKKEISRSHCEVRVTGWDVRLRDLGSNNGTFLIRPGQEPLRVSESSAVIVRIGDVIDLGEGVTIRVES